MAGWNHASAFFYWVNIISARFHIANLMKIGRFSIRQGSMAQKKATDHL